MHMISGILLKVNIFIVVKYHAIQVQNSKMVLESILYKNGTLQILNQLCLPHQTIYIDIGNVAEGWEAIHSMKVRGAPAIAIVGALSLAVELYADAFCTKEQLHEHITRQLDYLITARPTAVNMKKAAIDLTTFSESLLQDNSIDVSSMKNKIIYKIENMLAADVKANKLIGEYGADHIRQHCSMQPLHVLTHCNTGSLATAGYGTALGVIRSLADSKDFHVYCTETRPYSQGARLTAYELVHDKIPATLICDSMVAALMQTNKISAVIVGADRVAANGDTANKIGTYQIAISAKHHNIPFYVAAPTTSIDINLKTGKEIPIEERPHQEMTHIQGYPIAAQGIGCWNPSFDVTPSDLITGGIITEKGVFLPESLNESMASLNGK